MAAGAHRVTGLKIGPSDTSGWAPAFGALGDGTADDTAALKTMFAAAVSTGRTRMNIPAGNWVFSQKLPFGQNGIHLEGASLGSARLTFKPGTHGVVFTVGTLGALGTMTLTYNLDAGGAISCGSTAATLGGNFVFTVPGTAIDAIFPPGAYVSGATYTLSTAGVVTNSGGGPTMTYELVGIQLSAGASELALCGVHRLSFFSSGNTQKKIALDIVDCDQANIRDIYVDPTWTGSTSEGIRIRGRQSAVLDNIRSWADIPIHIASDPNQFTIVNCDHLHISNTYLVPTPGLGNACVLIDSNIIVSNLTIDGDNAWIVDKYGLYWNDTASVATSNNVVIKNIRCEQMQDATGYGIYIGRTGAVNLQNLLIENVMTAVGQNGMLVQNTLNATIQNCAFQANNAGQVHLDVSTGVADLLLVNNIVQINSTVNFGTMVQQNAAPKRLSGQNMPSTAHYADATTAALRGFQISALMAMIGNQFTNQATANTNPFLLAAINAFTGGAVFLDIQNPVGTRIAYVDSGGSIYTKSGIIDTPSATPGPVTIAPNFATSVGIGRSGIASKSTGAFAMATQAVAGIATTTITPATASVVLLGLVTATNVTTMIVGVGVTDGQVLDVHVIQPASGTPATVPTTWTNVNFAGGTFTNTATLAKRDIVTLRYSTATTKWYEVSRTLNIPN